ncbi:MAG: hypothetical protein IPL83_02435 [Bdellovibrionales bacterium]|nr:hypothetical protein [Bdellovibrionales bacterium]
MDTKYTCLTGSSSTSIKSSKKKMRIADLSKHRYFREPWALTFAGGADFEERRPRVTSKDPVPEFLGVSRIAISREVRALVRFIRFSGGLESFVSQQAWLAKGMGKVPAGIDPVAFVRHRLDYLLYLTHMTGAGAAKRRLRQIVGRPSRYLLPILQRSPENVASLRKLKRAPKVETVAQYLTRGGSIKVYSAPQVYLDKDGWAHGRVRLIREIVAGQVQIAA